MRQSCFIKKSIFKWKAWGALGQLRGRGPGAPHPSVSQNGANDMNASFDFILNNQEG